MLAADEEVEVTGWCALVAATRVVFIGSQGSESGVGCRRLLLSRWS